MFLPKPPKTILPNITAKTIPITTTYQGTIGGITNAKRVAVTKTASLTGLPARLAKIYSTIKPVRLARTTRKRQYQPK